MWIESDKSLSIASREYKQEPLKLNQGANDPRVPVTEAVQMLEKMKSKKIKFNLFVFSDEGHGAQKRGNRVATICAEPMFLKKHLMGK